MIKRTLFLTVLIVWIQSVLAQKTSVNLYASIDKKALQLPDTSAKTTDGIARYISSNFTNDKDKARAIFVWVATNFEYDIENIFAINFYEKVEDKINKPLATHKGICENYAAVFNDVCLKSGIRSYVVEGYTKQNGFTDYIPHAWCAAFIDTAWYLYDPTWGSGYINNGKFYKKIDNSYYKINPSTIIKTHMPFDYLWQFLNYPVTNQEFYEGIITQNKAKPFFNFKDSLQVYEQQSQTEKLVSSARRIEANGIRNGMIFDRLQHIKMEIENGKINLYNSAGVSYNEAINSLNAFIDYRNHQFIPQKEDADIQRMIDTVYTKLAETSAKLDSISNPDRNTATLVSQLTKATADAEVHAKEQQDWLTVYISKSKSKRKAMFYEKKITWFGIPLN